MTKKMTWAAKLLAVLLVLAMAVTLIPFQASAASSDATFTFSNSGVTASGSSDGYEIDGTTLTITSAGTYTVTGSCSDGSVVVKKGTTGVTLILKDLTLAASGTAPVVVKKTCEVTLDIEGTVNLTDNEDPADEESTDEEVADAFEGAAIKAKDGSTLTITGSGTLNIDSSSCKNGIKGGATTAITIAGSTINVNAAYNGIASDGSLTISGGTINVTAGNDGIKSDPDTDDTESEGKLAITGGTVTVSAADDGLKAYYDLILGTEGSSSGPTINIKESNEGIEGANVVFNSGSGTIVASDDGINAANSDLTTYDFLFTLNGGNWIINAEGDGVDSNGNIVNNGGSMVVHGSTNSGNAAMDTADQGGVWTSNGGSVLAIGMNGMTIVPTSGTYVAFGVNGMGGMGDMGGQAPSGDMGGTAPTGDMGGTAPSGNMGGMGGQAPSGNMGGQNGGMTLMSTTLTTGAGTVAITKGSTITIKDSSGNTVAETTAIKNANCVVYTIDGLTAGETYTLYVNGTAAATATATSGNGSSANGGQPSGQQPSGDSSNQQSSGTNSTYAKNTTPFTDVGTQRWYSEAINTVYAKGVMAGTSKTTFEPDTTLTRGMLLQMLYALEGKPAVTTKTTFSDVASGTWYYDAISWAQANGIAAGYGDGTVGPNDALTREAAVQILYSYAKYKNVSISGSKAISSFKDASSATWSKTALQWAYGNTLIAGFDDGTLQPKGTTTRAQMAQIMMRYLQLIGK